MKKLSLALALWASLPAMAQQTMRQLFTSMPDSILTTLTTNNRLDMVDFMDAGMKAEVTNKLEGTSRLVDLQADRLVLQMSEALTIEMLLVDLEEPIDSAPQAIAVMRTYRLTADTAATEHLVDYYSLRWNRQQALPQLTPDSRRRLPSLPPSTILRRDEEPFLHTL